MSRRAFTHRAVVAASSPSPCWSPSVVVSAGQQRADALRWPSERPPRPLAAKPVKFPPYEIRTLPNGLQVVLVSQNEQPVVSARMLIRAGAAQDPKGKEGLAMLTSALLDQGTTTRSAAPDRRGDRLHGRAARQWRRHRPQLRQHGEHVGRPRPRRWT